MNTTLFSESSKLDIHKMMIQMTSKVMSTPIPERGICYGIVKSGLMAVLSNQTALFNSRIEKIVALASVLDQGGAFAFDLDLEGFFQNIFVFQYPSQCIEFIGYLDKHLDSDFVTQERYFDHTVNLVASVALEKLGGLSFFKPHSAILDALDFNDFLIEFNDFFSCQETFTLDLGIPHHLISFSFHGTTKKYSLIDSNHLPIREDLEFETLYDYLMSELFPDDDVDQNEGDFEPIIIDFRFSYLKKDEKTLRPKIEDFLKLEDVKALLEIDDEKALFGSEEEETFYLFHVIVEDSEAFCLELLESKPFLLETVEKYQQRFLFLCVFHEKALLLNWFFSKHKDLVALHEGDFGYFLRSACISKRDLFDVYIKYGAPIDFRSPAGETALWSACHYGYKDRVVTLLDLNAEHTFCTKSGSSPLAKVAAMGHFDLLTLLIDRGADINFCDHKMLTPLFFAIMHGRKEMVTYLLDCGADLKKVPAKYGSFTIFALFKKREELAMLLLKKGDDIHARTENGESALEIAIQYNRVAVVGLLLAKKIDLSQTTSEGLTFLEFAKKQKDRRCARLLEKHDS